MFLWYCLETLVAEVVQPKRCIVFLLFLTGLTVEDFGKESQGEMIIEFLQMRHKCVITVQDSAAAAAASAAATARY